MNKEQVEKIAEIIHNTNPEISSNAEAQKIARNLVEHGVLLVVDTNGDPMPIRRIQDHAWMQGYGACREGQQPHSPYRQTKFKEEQ